MCKPDQDDKEIIKLIVENSYSIESKITLIKKIKMFGYYLINIIFNRHTSDRFNNIHVVGGKTLLRMIHHENFGVYEDFYYGDSQQTIDDIINKKTYFSYFNRRERIVLLLKSMIKFLSLKLNSIPLVYWMDYFFWDEFLEKTKVKIILSDGQNDRLTTMLSFLSKKKNIKFYMRQHGLISSKLKLPNRIYCTRFYSFDEDQAELFRKNIIYNDDCEYIIKYENNVVFEQIEKHGIVVGIIENPRPEMAGIIDLVINNLSSDAVIIIMLHPITKRDKYKAIKNKNIIFTYQKIWNLDLIISSVSTLVYDYIMQGFKNPIYFVDTTGTMPEFKEKFGNLEYIERIKQLEENLKNVKL